jgi:hypothetical protein
MMTIVFVMGMQLVIIINFFALPKCRKIDSFHPLNLFHQITFFYAIQHGQKQPIVAQSIDSLITVFREETANHSLKG